MKQITWQPVVLVTLILLCACGSIEPPTHQQLQVQSNNNTSCPAAWVTRDQANYISYSESQGENIFWQNQGYAWPQFGIQIFTATDINNDGLICTKKYPSQGNGKPYFYDLRRDNTTAAK